MHEIVFMCLYEYYHIFKSMTEYVGHRYERTVVDICLSCSFMFSSIWHMSILKEKKESA